VHWVRSCNLRTKLSLGLNCYCTMLFIHRKPYARSCNISASYSVKYRTWKQTYTDPVSITKASELVALHQRMPESHIHINKSTGFQKWQPAIQICIVPATQSQSSTQNVPETMHNNQFLYTTCKRPISSYATGMSLNCNLPVSGPLTSTSLNCQCSWPSSGTMLNCRTAQTTDNMASGHHGHLRHLRHLGIFGYWMDNMPSSHSSHLGHPSHLSHLGYLSTISNLNTLNPYLLATTPTDSYHGAFITKMDLNDPGLSEGYFVDNSLDPLPTATPLLPHYISQFPYTSQTALDGHSLNISLDTLDGHSSLLGEDTQADLDPHNLFTLDPITHLSLDY
jgi:hypothetical protein